MLYADLGHAYMNGMVVLPASDGPASLHPQSCCSCLLALLGIQQPGLFASTPGFEVSPRV